MRGMGYEGRFKTPRLHHHLHDDAYDLDHQASRTMDGHRHDANIHASKHSDDKMTDQTACSKCGGTVERIRHQSIYECSSCSRRFYIKGEWA